MGDEIDWARLEAMESRALELTGAAQSGRDPAAVEEALALFQYILNALPDGHPGRAMELSNLCYLLLIRFQADQDRRDLHAALEAGRLSIALAEPRDPDRSMYLTNYAAALHQSYKTDHDASELDAAVDLALEAVSFASGPTTASCSTLGMTLMSRYDRDRLDRDLDAAIDAFDLAVESGGPADGNLLVFAGMARSQRFDLTHRTEDIEAAVDRYQRAIAASGADDSMAGPPLRQLGDAQLTLFRYTGNGIADAITSLRRSVSAASAAGDGIGLALFSLGIALCELFEHTGDLTVADEAKSVLERARKLLVDDPPRRLRCLALLGSLHSNRFERTESNEDLDRAITYFRNLGDLATEDGDKATATTNLGHLTMKRFATSTSTDALDESLRWSRRAIEILGDGESGAHVSALVALGRTLVIAFDRSGDVEHLDEAARCLERAYGMPHPSRALRAQLPFHLGSLLLQRARHFGSVDDLDRSVELLGEASAALIAGHPERSSYLSMLSDALTARFNWSGSRADLNDAVRASRGAVEAAPEAAGFSRSLALSGLGRVLHSRHIWLGAPSDLNEAVEVWREATDALPLGHYTRSWCLLELSGALVLKYARSRDISDADAAVAAVREAEDAKAAPVTRAGWLNSLSAALRARSAFADRPDDGDEAVECQREAVRIYPEDLPGRTHLYSSLCISLMVKYEHSELSSDMEEAIEAARAATDLERDEDPNHAMCLTLLGVVLLARAKANDDDRGETEVVVAEQTSAISSQADREEARELFRRAAGMATAPAPARFQAIGGWTKVAVDREDWEDALEAVRAGIAELPRLAWHGLGRDDQLDALTRTEGLARTAAAVALQAGRPEEALQLLEAGRGVLLAQAMDARDDLLDLEARAPELAARIRAVRAMLDQDNPPPIPNTVGALTNTPALPAAAGGRRGQQVWEQRLATERRRELAEELDGLVQRAREVPGFEDFQRLPQLKRLLAAAEKGPVVVVNVSELRCDALIVTRDGVDPVPLPDLSVEGPGGLSERATALLSALASAGGGTADKWRAHLKLTETLKWLWEKVADPVSTRLRESESMPNAANAGSVRSPRTASGPGEADRIWWCPTGALALLPLHAAGDYGAPQEKEKETENEENDPKSLPSLYISSYTATLRALAAQAAHGCGTGTDMLAIDQSDTPGLAPLPHAREEVRLVSALVPDTTLLSTSEATRKSVLEGITDHSMLHFSGHGGQDPERFPGGALYCHDHERSGPLTIADIARQRPRRARLAYLSACETAWGVAELADEAVHLAGAMQLAGFTHVVAAQWVVDDACALQTAADFYAGLRTAGPADSGGTLGPDRAEATMREHKGGLDPDLAAIALHEAVRRMRKRGEDPLWWAAYVHIGP